MGNELQGLLERWFVGVARRTAVLLAVVTAGVFALGLCSGAVAKAASVDLCDGYAGCSTGGFNTHGYAANADSSWWRMYAGVNCTNYVAYVESQIFGTPDPTYVLGDADQWAHNAAANGATVDDIPNVGAVAFWGSGALDMGRYGHVAVVEAVGPNDSYIDVSQSGVFPSENGYDWEQISPGSATWETWPTAFIHFPGTQVPQSSGPPVSLAWPKLEPINLTWGPGDSGPSNAPLQVPNLG